MDSYDADEDDMYWVDPRCCGRLFIIYIKDASWAAGHLRVMCCPFCGEEFGPSLDIPDSKIN